MIIRCSSRKQSVFTLQARPLIMKKSFEELVDPLLAGVYDAEQMNRLVAVASMCINEFSTERPQMSQVVFYFTMFIIQDISHLLHK